MYHWNSPLKDLLREVKSHLYYTRTERRGIMILCFITLTAGIAPYVVPRLFPTTTPVVADIYALPDGIDLTSKAATDNKPLFAFDPNLASESELLALGIPVYLTKRILRYREKGGHFNKKEDLKKIYSFPDAEYRRLEPFIRTGDDRAGGGVNDWQKPTVSHFNFDPNTATPEALKQLGIPDFVVRNMLKYREKGGKFRYKEDFARIYGLPEAVYADLKDLIQLPAKDELHQANAALKNQDYPTTYGAGHFTKKKEHVIDINRATGAEWQQLKGIGPALATRIITFRDKLGGFCSLDQVAEIYALPDSTYRNIKPLLTISPVFRKIAINTATVEELAAHPYIKGNIARIIVNYRQQHGAFKSPEELYLIQALTKEAAAKIIPYISTTND